MKLPLKDKEIIASIAKEHNISDELIQKEYVAMISKIKNLARVRAWANKFKKN